MEKNELLKHLHSYDRMIGENSNLSYPSNSVQELMKIVEKTPVRVWIVLQESCVDGEIIVNAVPCASLKAAKKVLQDEKNTILHETHHFGNMTDDDMSEMEVEEDEESFYINDPFDDYYENIKIVDKILVE